MKGYDVEGSGRPGFEYTVLGVTDERYATPDRVTYVPVADTGTRDKMEDLVRIRGEFDGLKLGAYDPEIIEARTTRSCETREEVYRQCGDAKP